MSTITDAHHLLLDNQYYHKAQDKKRIVLHHTAGGTATSSINWWNEKLDHVCTPYLIDRDGTILEVFPPEYWAYALGINSPWAEKKSIQIELCSFGGLINHEGQLYRKIGDRLFLFDGPHVRYEKEHRGYLFFERYTAEQIQSLLFLLDHLANRFSLEIGDVEKFWWYDKESKKTLISHTTVRKDKSDIHPQPDLIQAIYDFAGCTAPVTE